jgi:selenide,water dikinase
MEQELSNELFICGGCNAKIGPGVLGNLLSQFPKQENPNFLVGFDSSDDAAVFRIDAETAMIQTLDFFPAMVADASLFGEIAAANALSDVFAMGGEVLTAMNIVCWPETKSTDTLGKILAGGFRKVQEAGGVLVGGHSIHDPQPKYGLSVLGRVHPDRIYRNDTCLPGNVLLLTKPLGTGIITTAYSAGEMAQDSFDQAVTSMTTLNRYAAEVLKKYTVHSCTDITGFGLLGHLSEMVSDRCSATVYADSLPCLSGAYQGAKEFLITAGGQRNRNHLEDDVDFQIDDYALEEILFDPQTSGGLLVSVPVEEAAALLAEIEALGLPCAIIGEVTEKDAKKITVVH